MKTFAQQVYEFLLTVPKNKTVTYGKIAEAIGRPGAARAVGNALHRNPDPDRYPCFRAVNANGELSEHFAYGGLEGQKKRLEQAGIPVTNNKVSKETFYR